MNKYKVLLHILILVLLNGCASINRVYISNYTDRDILIRVNCKIGDFDIEDISSNISSDSLYSSPRAVNFDTFIPDTSIAEVYVFDNDGKSYSTIIKPKTTLFLLPMDSYTPIESVYVESDTLYLLNKRKLSNNSSKPNNIELMNSRHKGKLIKIVN